MHLQNFSVKLLSVDNMKHSKIREATFNPMQGSNFFIITGTKGNSSLTTLITVRRNERRHRSNYCNSLDKTYT